MIRLIYGNVNVKTKFSYAVYKVGNKYYVQKRDEDGHLVLLLAFKNEEDACVFVRRECR